MMYYIICDRNGTPRATYFGTKQREIAISNVLAGDGDDSIVVVDAGLGISKRVITRTRLWQRLIK